MGLLAISFGLLLFFQAHFIKLLFKNHPPASKDEKSWQRQRIVFFKNSALYQLSSRAPLYLLEWLGQSETDLAAYGVCSTIQSLFTSIQSVLVYNLLLNQAGHLYPDNPEKLQKELNTTMSLLLIIGLCLVITILIFNQSKLHVFGKNYMQYTFILALFLLNKMIELFNDGGFVLLEIDKHGPGRLKKYNLSNSYYLIVYAVSIYYFGLYGLLSAAIFSMIIYTITIVVDAKELTRLKPLIWI